MKNHLIFGTVIIVLFSGFIFNIEGGEAKFVDQPDVPLMEKAEESSSVWKVKKSLRWEAVLYFRRFVSVNLLTETIDSLVIIYHLT